MATQAAQAAFAQDVGSGLVKPGNSSRSTTSSTPIQKPTAAKPPKPSDPWANYTTAASLGYTDPEEERMKAEAERRRTQGVAGEWEVVEQQTENKVNDEVDSTSEPPKKREAEGLRIQRTPEVSS
jgi:WW domain-binding protein 4